MLRGVERALRGCSTPITVIDDGKTLTVQREGAVAGKCCRLVIYPGDSAGEIDIGLYRPGADVPDVAKTFDLSSPLERLRAAAAIGNSMLMRGGAMILDSHTRVQFEPLDGRLDYCLFLGTFANEF